MPLNGTENPSSIWASRPLAQYLESDKRQVLNPCVTINRKDDTGRVDIMNKCSIADVIINNFQNQLQKFK